MRCCRAWVLAALLVGGGVACETDNLCEVSPELFGRQAGKCGEAEEQGTFVYQLDPQVSVYPLSPHQGERLTVEYELCLGRDADRANLPQTNVVTTFVLRTSAGGEDAEIGY